MPNILVPYTWEDSATEVEQASGPQQGTINGKKNSLCIKVATLSKFWWKFIFVFLSFTWSDGYHRKKTYDLFDILVKCLGTFCCER